MTFIDFVKMLIFLATAVTNLLNHLKKHPPSVTSISHILIVGVLTLQLFGLLLSAYVACVSVCI